MATDVDVNVDVDLDAEKDEAVEQQPAETEQEPYPEPIQSLAAVHQDNVTTPGTEVTQQLHPDGSVHIESTFTPPPPPEDAGGGEEGGEAPPDGSGETPPPEGGGEAPPAALTATAFDPTSAAAGDTVGISGTGFVDPMTVTLWSDTANKAYPVAVVTVESDAALSFTMPSVDAADVGGPPIGGHVSRQADGAEATLGGLSAV